MENYSLDRPARDAAPTTCPSSWTAIIARQHSGKNVPVSRSWWACFTSSVHPQIGKISLSVGLGPQADLARILERIVFHVEVRFSVEVTLDVVAFVDDFKLLL